MTYNSVSNSRFAKWIMTSAYTNLRVTYMSEGKDEKQEAHTVATCCGKLGHPTHIRASDREWDGLQGGQPFRSRQ